MNHSKASKRTENTMAKRKRTNNDQGSSYMNHSKASNESIVCNSFMETETSETFENLNLTACLVIRYHSDNWSKWNPSIESNTKFMMSCLKFWPESRNIDLKTRRSAHVRLSKGLILFICPKLPYIPVPNPRWHWFSKKSFRSINYLFDEKVNYILNVST